MAHSRDRSLDGARGLAILLVVLYHSTLFRQVESLLDELLVALPRLGWSGVDLFFVLSGFLITRILLRERETPLYFKPFYARRVLRIFPLYYALLIAVLLVIPRFDALALYNFFWAPNASPEPIWYWLFLGNFYAGATGQFHHDFLAITWSLAIEEQFYLVWPFLVWILPSRVLRRVCWGAIGLAFALRCGFLWQGIHPLAVYVMTPFRMDTLAVGALIAVVSKEDGGFEGLGRVARYGLPISFVACAGLSALLIVSPGIGGAPRGTTLLGHPWMQTVGYSLLAILYGFLVVHLLARPTSGLSRRFEAGWLRVLGKYSYAIYLLHFPAAWLVMRWIFNPHQYDWPFAAEQAIRYVCVLGLSAAMAWVSWQILEAPAQRLRRFFPYRESDEEAAG